MKPPLAPLSRTLLGRLELQPAERRLWLDGREVTLGSRAYGLLCALVARRDRVVGKDELIEEVWPGLVVEENNLQVQISALRKLLGPQAIRTLPGLGYRFTLPAEGEPPAEPAAAAAGVRLLVVEDNRVTRLLLTRTLELMGHRVDAADNGRSALELLRRGEHDLVLLDLELPELSGLALLQARCADPALQDTPVIVTSVHDDVPTVARCIELGADDHLRKPVDPVLLKARLESSLARRQLRQLQRPGTGPRLGLDSVPVPPRLAETTVLAVRLSGVEAAAGGLAAAEAMLERMGNWCTLMFEAVRARGGAVRQCGGDALLATFDASRPALDAAHEMVVLSAQFSAESCVADGPPMRLHIGLARGAVLVGRVGQAPSPVCACSGAAVQRAEALQAAAALAGHALLMDAAVAAQVPARVVALPGSAAAQAFLPGR